MDEYISALPAGVLRQGLYNPYIAFSLFYIHPWRSATAPSKMINLVIYLKPSTCRRYVAPPSLIIPHFHHHHTRHYLLCELLSQYNCFINIKRLHHCSNTYIQPLCYKTIKCKRVR